MALTASPAAGEDPGSPTPTLNVLDDPTPSTGGGFGISSSGLGDVAPGDATPANELLVGAFGPNSPDIPNPNVLTDVHIFNAATETALQSIADRDAQRGSGFGSGVVPLGDVNDDGYLDFAAGADLHDTLPGGNEGRLYIFRSDSSPPCREGGARARLHHRPRRRRPHGHQPGLVHAAHALTRQPR